MHTPKANLEFQVTWNETNLNYLLGENPVDQEKVAKSKAALAESKEKLAQLDK